MKIIDVTSYLNYEDILYKIIEQDTHLYNATNYTMLYKYFVKEQPGNHGLIKGFVYGASLRFKLVFESAPEYTVFQTLATMINQTCESNKKNKIMLWYSQINGKLQCHELIKLLPIEGEPYYYSEFTIPRNEITIPSNEIKKGT